MQRLCQSALARDCSDFVQLLMPSGCHGREREKELHASADMLPVLISSSSSSSIVVVVEVVVEVVVVVVVIVVVVGVVVQGTRYEARGTRH